MVKSVAVVTGGASGIGAAVAAQLAREGHRVVILDRDKAAMNDIAARIGGHGYYVDIRDDGNVRSVIDMVERDQGPIQILVNSAGILQPPASPADYPMPAWDRIVAVHLRGSYLMSAVVGTRMASRRVGAIVSIASVLGMRSSPLHAYGPAKAAIIAMTENLAAEWGPAGVRVNAVSPGFVKTPAVARGVAEQVLDTATMAETSALGRMVLPEEVAEVICFLTSARASAITGCNLPVDAGFLVAGSWRVLGGLRPSEPAST